MYFLHIFNSLHINRECEILYSKNTLSDNCTDDLNKQQYTEHVTFSTDIRHNLISVIITADVTLIPCG